MCLAGHCAVPVTTPATQKRLQAHFFQHVYILYNFIQTVSIFFLPVHLPAKKDIPESNITFEGAGYVQGLEREPMPLVGGAEGEGRMKRIAPPKNRLSLLK